MSPLETRLDQASRTALAHRLRLATGVAAARQRLQPSRLIDDGKRRAKETATALVSDSKAHVAAHPALVSAGVAVLAAWIFRKPLLRHAPPLFNRGYDWLAGKLSFSQLVQDERLTVEPWDSDVVVDDGIEGDAENDFAADGDPHGHNQRPGTDADNE